MFRKLVTSYIPLMAALGLLSACSKPMPAEEPVRAVKVVSVGMDAQRSAVEYSGEVRARVESNLGFRVAGKIIRRQVELGRQVRAGEILAQLAYGQAAHVGHTATRDLQVQGYYSDVQQPMLYGVNQYVDLPLAILVGLQSANQNASVDVAMLILQHWDFTKLAKPIWQSPAGMMGFAIAPGPIVTIMSGFQRLREAGPLVYPSRLETYRGTGSS